MSSSKINSNTTVGTKPTVDPAVDGLIGLFQLNTAGDTSAPARSALHESATESTFDPDYRTVVDPSLYKDGGIYRCK